MELWQIGAFYDPTAKPKGLKRDLVAERMAHAQDPENFPEPEPDDSEPDAGLFTILGMVPRLDSESG